MNKIEKFINQADKYLKEADNELNEGNLRQASEKYWGAASQVVKAYAEQKGLNHDGHAQLFRAVDELCKEIGKQIPTDLFAAANVLHINFYDAYLILGEVRRYSQSSKRFIKLVKENLEV